MKRVKDLEKPMAPPGLRELFSDVVSQRPEEFGEQYGRYADTISAQPYLHWDDMRYREPPDGLNLKSWWLITKMARRGMQRQLSLVDEHGKPFVFALTDQVLREIEFVGTNASGRIGSSEPVTNPATRDRYLVTSLIEEAITSSQLEGASTERRVAREMLRSGRPPRDRSERMIVNNFRAMERVGELRNEDLTIDLICELQRIVTDGTLDNPDAAGRFQREDEDRVAVYYHDDYLIHKPPPAKALPTRMQHVCDFANATDTDAYLPGVLRALAIHFMIAYEHPFEDGNGCPFTGGCDQRVRG